VKISGAERLTASGAPPYDDVVPFARALLAAAPDRVLWGTDWPHPNVRAMPDDGDLVDLLADFAPDEALRTQVLVDNPRRLYDLA
jgi:2-pyrone-4,6-dicarboxylate lactonase